MKRLAMIAATGVMALMISACGDNAPQKPEVQADDMQPQVQQPAEAAPAAPVPVEPAAIAPEAPEAPAAPVVAAEPGQPTDDAIADSTVQE